MCCVGIGCRRILAALRVSLRNVGRRFVLWFCACRFAGFFRSGGFTGFVRGRRRRVFRRRIFALHVVGSRRFCVCGVAVGSGCWRLMVMMRVGCKDSSAGQHQDHNGPGQFIEVHPIFLHKASEALKRSIPATLGMFRNPRVCLPTRATATSIIKRIF